jgi:hypothetical protein
MSLAQPLHVCFDVSQIGLASGQSLLARHATQTWSVRLQTGLVGSAALHCESVMHATQLWVVIVSQWEVAVRPEQSASAEQGPQVLPALQTGAETGQFAFVRQATQRPPLLQ